MAVPEDKSEIITADILIIGGGIGGLVTAVKAKEENPDADVLIVEKQTTGWAGKATKIGGILAFLGPDNDADKFMDFQVRSSGFYLNDQEILAKYVSSTYGAIEDLNEWGARLARTPDGNLVSIPTFYAPEWSMTFIDIDLMQPIMKRARQQGTRFMNKVHIVDLLKTGNTVAGAVGFDIITGIFYTFKAKATILANGSCGYKVRRYWVAGTGDGIAAAYRAGAEMRNAEYGNLYGHTVWQDTDSGMVGHQYLVNAQGENMADKYLPDQGPTGVFLPVPLAVGLEKEVAEGRGPIYFSPPPSGPSFGGHTELPKLKDWQERMAEKEKKYGLPPDVRRQIAVPLHGETSCIRVDHDMKTSLEGLWAIGDTSYAGSAVAGAVASPPGITPGSGIMFAIISGGWAGISAARYTRECSPLDVEDDDVTALKTTVYAPMQKDRTFPPEEAVSSLQDLTAPMKYNLRRSGERLQEALTGLENLNEKIASLQAKDYHYLSKCHEIQSMKLCAELTYRAALARKESRGSHFREDYPERDDNNWLQWIILKQESGRMTLVQESIPVDTYNIKPDRQE